MRREPIVPLGVWLPALIAGVALVLFWKPSAKTPLARAVVQAPSAAPVPDVASVSAVDPPAADVVAPPPPSAAPPPIEGPIAPPIAPPTALEPAATAVREPDQETPPAERFPDGWRPLDVAEGALDDSAFGQAAARGIMAWRAQLGDESAHYHCSAGALAPLVVFAREGGANEAFARTLVAFHRELVARVLQPANLALARDAADQVVVVEVDHAAEPDERSRDAVDAVRAIGERWLDAIDSARGSSRPPHWWRVGAIEVARSATLHDALAAAEPSARLATLFMTGAGTEPIDAALAGSFAAFCLGAGGRDDHLRATWLEFGRPPAAAAELPAASPDGAAEIAARFGCTRIEELEAAWDAARRR